MRGNWYKEEPQGNEYRRSAWHMKYMDTGDGEAGNTRGGGFSPVYAGSHAKRWKRRG